ncbi:phosphotransferase system glucose/maltose/N-acetylglucosamine-specific IIC component [Peribacillus huizhouensis]|uniref:Phosphotransferase system glucose/maltose/N-acetylglucosamine-specific IIC component n=1 Tax=Peribacillus huizhouensis TaxID=1501239 RepID=A0ABR6CWE1_9BACI|nr:phosphotransferase system glucose/maltose/N-acetylglucosamine-specific IIC component [Peribacillus huizhouensis]
MVNLNHFLLQVLPNKCTSNKLKIIFAQLRDNVELTAGTFTTGMYPLKMFTMLAAALAIYHCARPEKKKMVGGIMLQVLLLPYSVELQNHLNLAFYF